MKNFISRLFVVCFLMLVSGSSFANNISVSNIILTGQNTTAGVNNAANYTIVQFDISWDDSWRASSGDPTNYDAAWVFVKYRVTGGVWQHAWLNTTNGNHTAPSGSEIKIGATDISGTNRGIGAFFQRSGDGTGIFSKTGVQLRWEYGANGVADGDAVDIDVFAIEMVYVPPGSFSAGSGGVANNEFTLTTINTGTANISGGYPTGQTAPNASWPNGYNAFYCMKYEIMQQQYVDFLNTLTQTQATNRKYNMTGTDYRYAITGSTVGSYATTNQYVACNYLSWADLAAYLDWSGLRPMTELEFEKSCRGTQTAVLNEYAWGNATVFASAYTFSGVTAGTESEVVSNPGSGVNGNANYSTTGSTIGGPLRVGSFATSGSDRIVSGATYYGIMEMSGNLSERPVTIGNVTGRAFTGTHGNGVLTVAGDADASNWPGTDALGAGYRGGSWSYSAATTLQVSDRIYAVFTDSYNYQNSGGRGVRSSP